MTFRAVLAVLAGTAFALPSQRDFQPGKGPWQYDAPSYQSSPGVAAYFLDNDPIGSSIVSLHIAHNGTIGQPYRTSTAGNGSIEVNSTGSPFPSDSLGSQGSVTISENMLFTVNAGSNTVSMFSIDPEKPYNPTLVGSPVDTQGEFPISVTYSSKLRKLCVLNGGAKAGVSCFAVDPVYGLHAVGPLRALNSSIINETTLPSGPPGSAAQVLFNPDSSALFATVKANSTDLPGSLLAWPVANGDVSTSEPMVTQIEGISLDFGFEFISQDTIFLSDPSFGISLLQVGLDFTTIETAHTTIDGQGAICWTLFDRQLDTLYAIDAGKDLIYKINPLSGAYEGSISIQLPGPSTVAGVFDSTIWNGKMYSLAATNGIVVVDLAKQSQVQYLDLSSFGNRQHYQGMAVWPTWGYGDRAFATSCS